MMSAMSQDFYVVGDKHHWKLMVQGNLLSRKDHNVVGKGLTSTYIGAYWLLNLTSIHEQCKFNLVPTREHTFKLVDDKQLISAPESYTSTLWCPANFKTIYVQPIAIETVPLGCSLQLHFITIEPHTNSGPQGVWN